LFLIQLTNRAKIMQFFSQASSEMQIFIISISALVLGSFFSLITHRMFSKQAMVLARSECTNCGCKLKIQNLIPLFSWIFQGGKCSNCKCKISIRYPLIELTFLLSFLAIFFVLDRKLDVKMLLYFAVAATLIFMCIIDLEHYFIPNETQIFLAFFAALLLLNGGVGPALLLTNLKAAFLYALFGGALWLYFYFIAKMDALGIDDIKFFFVVGLMLGLKSFLAFMILSGILGIIFGSLWQNLKKDETFPFAPAICLSAFLCLLFGKKLDPVNLIGALLF
jgi:leader peptidase (prepilin peptidase)/N-methyltransferase